MVAQLLTHSRIDVFKTCRKRHWFSYEIGVRPTEDARALRMGSAYHVALEVYSKSKSLDEACAAIYARYDAKPDEFNHREWEIEQETVLRLLCGYVWRWQHDHLEHIASEMPFELSLKNPETQCATPNWMLAGKIDGIVQLEDRRLAVIEHKLLSEELNSDSPLWRRLRIDHQISLYVVAARRMKFQVDCVLYNATRKPTIKPTNIPILDDLGAKIVLDKYGERVKTERGGWRQTGDNDKGYILQTRPMTAQEWGEKLAADICERPEFYFSRVEIPRLDQDLEEYEYELWDIQRTIREAQLYDRHYRTCNRETCAWCPHFSLCTTGWQPTDALPETFEKVDDLYPELNRQPIWKGDP